MVRLHLETPPAVPARPARARDPAHRVHLRAARRLERRAVVRARERLHAALERLAEGDRLTSVARIEEEPEIEGAEGADDTADLGDDENDEGGEE